MDKRSCGSCTKCCDGWLTGEVMGHRFFPGRPCHFVASGKGCSIYSKRPVDPCISFKCSWLKNQDIPEWMKPDQINAIICDKEINGIPYISVVEAGSILDSRVLSWIISYVLKNQLNLSWEADGGTSYIGNSDFIEQMDKKF